MAAVGEYPSNCNTWDQPPVSLTAVGHYSFLLTCSLTFVICSLFLPFDMPPTLFLTTHYHFPLICPHYSFPLICPCYFFPFKYAHYFLIYPLFFPFNIPTTIFIPISMTTTLFMPTDLSIEYACSLPFSFYYTIFLYHAHYNLYFHFIMTV